MPTGTRAHLPDRTVISAAPGQLPRPPGRPPAEPIIIRIPPRPHDDLEIEMPEREDDDGGEIRRPPRWVPDPPPPAPPEQRTGGR